MDPANENHPKRWKWRLEWLFQTGFEKFAALLPGPVAFRVGEWIGGLIWYLLPQRRATVMRNLRIACHGDHDLAGIRRMAKENFRRTGANLLAAARCASLSPEQLDALVSIENQEIIVEALAAGRGLVLLPPHMGNWEILSRLNRLLPQGHAAGAFFRPLNNPLLNARVQRQREVDGTRMFSKRDSLHQVNGFLHNGGMIGILADQRSGTQGELTSFFGRLTRSSPLPSLMARRSKSPVFAMSLASAGPGRWTVRFHPVAAPYRTAQCMAALETAMRVSLVDVFWFQERWKVYISRYDNIQSWLGTDAPGGGKPHRAVVWLAGLPADWQLPAVWQHPDVIYEAVIAPGQALPAWLPAATRCYTAPASGSVRTLRKFIANIEYAAPLPVDFIVSIHATPELVKAAKCNGIQAVSLPT